MPFYSSGGSIVLNAAPTADKWSGFHTFLTAHDAFTLGKVGAVNTSGEVALANATTVASACAVYLALGTVTAHTVGRFLLPGGYIHLHTLAPAWTIGGRVYLSTTDGLLTQTPPAVPGNAVQILGVAVAADILHFVPQLFMVEVS
jgi:hypothetical protein